MKTKELKKLSNKELQNLLLEKREKVRQLRFGLSQKKVKNIREIREVKKDIARILTILKNIKT
jgi:large subunit ribosomal protein L29